MLAGLTPMLEPATALHAVVSPLLVPRTPAASRFIDAAFFRSVAVHLGTVRVGG